MSPEDSINQYRSYQDERNKAKVEKERSNEVVRNYQAEYENACDDLYYGYGYKFWFEQQMKYGSDMSQEEAKIVWKAAFNKMANED